MRKSKWHSTRNKMFICTNDVYHRRKIQSKDDSEGQDTAAVVGFAKFIKWTWKLNCD